MKTCFFLRGLPASGKSTWSKEKIAEYKRVGKQIAHANKDTIRLSVCPEGWSKKKEKKVVETETAIVESAMKDGIDIIIDNTHFAKVHENRYRALAEQHGYEFEIVDFTHVPLEECIRRDNARANGVGESVIKDMWRRYVRPPFEPPPSPYTSLPSIAICDMDGTIADLNGRNAYDASTCIQDKVRWHVLHTLDALYTCSKIRGVVFFTGREDKHREMTLEWLNTEVAKFVQFELHMRKTGDLRQDAIIKREMYDSYVRGNYHVFAVFDDRPQVVRMWQSLSLPVFCCNTDYDNDF